MSKNGFVEKIEVASPCSESWDEMAGNDVVRFCSHCAKSVNNLSEMTPRQAAKLVRKSGGSLCITYKKQPETGLPIFAQKINRLAARSGIAAGVIGASILLADAAYAQTVADPTAVVQADQTPRTDGGGAGKLSGYVTDPNGAVIPFALVSITNKDTSEYRTANATAEGLYEFSDLPAGNYTVKFEAGGFDAKESSVYVSEASSMRRDAQLALPQVAEVVTVGGEERIDISVGGAMITIESTNPLVQAVIRGDIEDVKALVMMRGKVNGRDKAYDGITPLHAAVETGNVEIAQFLLSRGAKINSRDFLKRTPLMMLDEDATPEMFQLLMTYGAKVKLVDKERNTVLHHFAAYDEKGEMIRTLVSYGVDVNAVNKEGKTALMIAAENESAANIEALVQSGADPNKIGPEGKTAWMLTDDAATRTTLETFGATAMRD
jgi:hypothetical protein